MVVRRWKRNQKANHGMHPFECSRVIPDVEAQKMKWYQPYNLSVPLVIIIGCIIVGVIQGSRRADQIIATCPQQIDNHQQFRREIRSRFIVGNLMLGGPFALVLFFALMPLNRRHRRKGPYNQSS